MILKYNPSFCLSASLYTEFWCKYTHFCRYRQEKWKKVLYCQRFHNVLITHNVLKISLRFLVCFKKKPYLCKRLRKKS
jgi:hypothetical protein